MMFDLKTRRVELLAEPRGSMVLRNSEIYGKSPFIRGNKLESSYLVNYNM